MSIPPVQMLGFGLMWVLLRRGRGAGYGGGKAPPCACLCLGMQLSRPGGARSRHVDYIAARCYLLRDSSTDIRL